MEQGFFTTTLIQPLYNGLIFLVDHIPGADAGIAIIIFTIVVRFALFPLSRKQIETQIKMRALEPELAQIRAGARGDRRKEAEGIMRFYKERKLNPLSGFFLILIQIPIIFALYHVFLSSGLPEINMGLLYDFVDKPEMVNMHFLGLLDISAKSYLMAALCGISQYFQMHYALPATVKKTDTGQPSFRDDLARSMNMQMRYIFPVVAFFISYSLSGLVALYWTTSNLFAIGQEFYVRKKINPEQHG